MISLVVPLGSKRVSIQKRKIHANHTGKKIIEKKLSTFAYYLSLLKYRKNVREGRGVDVKSHWITLTLNPLMSYIYMELLVKPEILTSYIYIYLRLATLKTVFFYFMHNVSTLNQCRKFSCVTIVCKHFVNFQGYPNYKLDLIR
jgi:hypothetical protein